MRHKFLTWWFFDWTDRIPQNREHMKSPRAECCETNTWQHRSKTGWNETVDRCRGRIITRSIKGSGGYDTRGWPQSGSKIKARNGLKRSKPIDLIRKIEHGGTRETETTRSAWKQSDDRPAIRIIGLRSWARKPQRRTPLLPGKATLRCG